MGEVGHVYEVRFGWSWAAVRAAALSTGLLALACVPGPPLYASALLGLFAGPTLLMTVVLATARPVALRVDPKGVTLNGLPFGPRPLRARRVPWAEVASITLWTERPRRLIKVPHIGVRYKARSVRPLPPSDVAAVQDIDAYLATQVPAEFVERFRGTDVWERTITLWRLDAERLRSTVEACAPEVYFFGGLD